MPSYGNISIHLTTSTSGLLEFAYVILYSEKLFQSSRSLLTPQSMSARQPFFSARPASEPQGTAQGFHPKPFSIDSSNPLHLSSPVANQSESMKTAFSVPGPFSSNGASSAPQIKTSGLGGASKRKSAHSLTQSVERDRKGSLNSVGFSASFSHNCMSHFPSSLTGFG